ncbi:unnamed protein product [Bemisia tabaci]|uniref:Uncharacterized protein n=1 Tax=Bemisia tabaci TaxID=7038 RepID=A0A9P0CF95_BEMTA|nr:unnamed protein product [Bemisia tabaci]
MPPWRIFLVSLLTGVWGVSGGPPSSSNVSQKAQSRSSIVFPYDDSSQYQYASVGSSYYGSAAPPSLFSSEPPSFSGMFGGGSSYSSQSLSLGPSPSPAESSPAGTRYIFPQEEIIMGSAASHSPYVYYADPPPGGPKMPSPSYAEYPPGYRPAYASMKPVYMRETYKPSYESTPANYGLHPAVANSINRLRKPYYRNRYPGAAPYYLMPPFKKLHHGKYPMKEIPNPDVINNALITSPFKSKYYKQRLPIEQEEELQMYEEPTLVRRPKKKHPQHPQHSLDPNFEIQPSIELDLEGQLLTDRERHKKGYEYDTEKQQSAHRTNYYGNEKPYKTSYDSDKEFYEKPAKAHKRRPAVYEDPPLEYTAGNYETSYRLEHPYEEDYSGPVNPFVDDDSQKYGTATSYVSITKPRVIGFKTLRDREYRDMEELPEESSPSPAPVLSYKPASSSVSNWTPINAPSANSRSYLIQAPHLTSSGSASTSNSESSNKRAGIVTSESLELDYNSRIKMIEDSRPIIGKPYKGGERSSNGNGNISKLDNSEGVVSAVMFFKQ